MTDFDPYLQWLGIPPHEQPPDHYRLLGLRRFEADLSVIQSATDNRMALVHTYQSGPRAPFTQKLLNELAAAKLCLLNPYSKSEYDAALGIALTGTAQTADAMLPASVPNALAASEPWGSSRQLTYYPPQLPAFEQSSFPAATARDKAHHSNRVGRRSWLMAICVAIAVSLGFWSTTLIIYHRSTPPINSAPPTTLTDESGLATKPDGSSTLGSPSDATLLTQEASGLVVFPMSVAMLQGQAAYESLDVGNLLTGWRNADDVAAWRFKVVKLPSQGIFRVRLTYQASRDATDAEYVVTLDGEEQSHDIRAYDRLVEDELYLAVKRGGEHTLTFSVRNLPAAGTFGLKQLEFSFPRTNPKVAQ